MPTISLRRLYTSTLGSSLQQTQSCGTARGHRGIAQGMHLTAAVFRLRSLASSLCQAACALISAGAMVGSTVSRQQRMACS